MGRGSEGREGWGGEGSVDTTEPTRMLQAGILERLVSPPATPDGERRNVTHYSRHVGLATPRHTHELGSNGGAHHG